MTYTSVGNYYRQKHFDFFATYENPFYALTFEVDMTAVKAFAKENNYSLYFNLCYLFTRAANEVEGLRYRLHDGIVLYECLHPRLIIGGDEGRYGFLALDYERDIHGFNAAAKKALANMEAEDLRQESSIHTNFVFFTSLPKIPFSGLTHAPMNSRTSGEPMVSFGRFQEKEGRLMVPIGLQVNHLFVDGHMLGLLYDRLVHHFTRIED